MTKAWNLVSDLSSGFFQADLNNDGLIDWDEFVQMMMPEGEGEQTDYASAANKHPADATTHPKTNKWRPTSSTPQCWILFQKKKMIIPTHTVGTLSYSYSGSRALQKIVASILKVALFEALGTLLYDSQSTQKYLHTESQFMPKSGLEFENWVSKLFTRMT